MIDEVEIPQVLPTKNFFKYVLKDKGYIVNVYVPRSRYPTPPKVKVLIE